MKKLMIAAAGAALVGGAFADAPQVYDMTLTVKQALCSGKTAADPCNDGGKVYYKTQSTVKYQGLFWGCGCDVIACPAYYTAADADGFIFWNASTKQWAAHNATFAWGLLNAVGQKGQNVEGQWTLQLEDCDGNVVADYTGAGYGTATWKCADEDNVIKSMNGNLVGLNNIALGGAITGCKYCGEEVACTSWAFCDDCGIDDDTLTASFGTWTLKYNSSLTKKLAQGKYIDEAYKFLAAVKAEMACIEAGVDPVIPEPTPASKLAENLKKAQAAYDDAVKSNEVAKAAYEALVDDLLKFTTKYGALKDAEGKTNKQNRDAALDALEKTYTDATGFTLIANNWKFYANRFIADTALTGAQATYGTNWINALTKSYTDKAKYASETQEISYKQKLEKNRSVKAADLEQNEKNLNDAKANFDLSVGELEVVKRGQVRDAVAALEAFAAGSEDITVPYKAAVYEWEEAPFFKADGTTMTPAEKKQAENDAKAATEAARIVYEGKDGNGGTNKDEVDAKNALSTAKMACLVATGSEECK